MDEDTRYRKQVVRELQEFFGGMIFDAEAFRCMMIILLKQIPQKEDYEKVKRLKEEFNKIIN